MADGLEGVALALVVDGKGILAADEIVPTSGVIMQDETRSGRRARKYTGEIEAMPIGAGSALHRSGGATAECGDPSHARFCDKTRRDGLERDRPAHRHDGHPIDG